MKIVIYNWRKVQLPTLVVFFLTSSTIFFSAHSEEVIFFSHSPIAINFKRAYQAMSHKFGPFTYFCNPHLKKFKKIDYIYFCGLKYCQYNHIPCYALTTKLDQKGFISIFSCKNLMHYDSCETHYNGLKNK